MLFKVECMNCDGESHLELIDGEIVLEGNIIIAVGDGEISTVYCQGCKNKIESE